MFWKTWVQLTESRSTGSRPWVPPLFTMATKLPWEMPGSGLPKSLLRDEPTEAGEEEAAPSAAMRNLQQLADEATRTARKNYLWMALYAVLMFFLAVFAGLTYKHYKVTGELLPLQWLGIESPKAALKSMTPPQAADAAQQ